MSFYQTEEQKFSRRLFVLGGTQVGLFAIIAGRLQYLQIARADEYATLAEANRVNITQISAQPRNQPAAFYPLFGAYFAGGDGQRADQYWRAGAHGIGAVFCPVVFHLRVF